MSSRKKGGEPWGFRPPTTVLNQRKRPPNERKRPPNERKRPPNERKRPPNERKRVRRGGSAPLRRIYVRWCVWGLGVVVAVWWW